MDFLESVVDFLHDILYSDNIPTGYKQQAHKLLDQYRDETGNGLEYQGSLKDWDWEIVTTTQLGRFRIKRSTYDEIEAQIAIRQKINAIKALRAEGEIRDKITGTVISQTYGLKESKEVIDGWDTWKKIKVNKKQEKP